MTEKPNFTQKLEHSPDSNAEKHEVMTEKFEKIARFAGVAGLVGLAAYMAKETYTEYDSVIEHEAHVESVLTAEEFQQYTEIKVVLEGVYGEAVFERLIAGDRAAFMERSQELVETKFEGFDNDSHLGEIANIEHYPDYVFTESFDLYPEGWINGEIAKVEIRNGDEAPTEGDNVHGGHHDSRSSLIVVYNVSDTIAAADFSPAQFDEYMQHTFAHEAAHANDWETKSDLTILERAEFLQSVTDRMSSDTAYSDKSLQDGSDYWRSYADGTQEGLRKMAKEYWAVISAAYFTEPHSLQADSLEDFELVQRIIAKTDSNFDITDSERGAYNPMTGSVRDKWLDDVQEIIESKSHGE